MILGRNALALAAVGAAFFVCAGSTRSAEAPSVQPLPDFSASYNDWGEHGLIQDPNARVGNDGDVSFTFSHVHPYDRYNFFLTPLPWLETGFRYTDITNRLYGPVSFSGHQSYKDRSFEAKIRLIKESGSFPEVAVGIRDLAGTGLFDSEYLVASRRYYNFDFTAGLGWGLMATRAALPNPFGLFGKSFKTRPVSTSAGSFSFSPFHGPNVGLFGGVEYHTPVKNLSVKLELDSDDYQQEPLGNSFSVKSPINAAIEYRPRPYMDLSAGVERGTTFMLRITFHGNLHSAGVPRQDTPPPKLEPRPSPAPPPGKPLDETALPQMPASGDPGFAQLAVTPAPAARSPVAVAQRSESRPGWSPAGRPLDATDLPQMPAADAAGGARQLFAGARALGYQVDDVRINGPAAALTVSPLPARRQGSVRELAQLSNRSLGVSSTVIAEARRLGPPRRPPLPAIGHETVAAAALAGAPAVTPAVQQRVAKRIFRDLRKIGFTGLSFAMAGDQAHLAFSQRKYRNPAIAIGRAARVVAANAPPGIEVLNLDVVEHGLTVASVQLMRRDLERAVSDDGSPEEIWANARLSGSDPGFPPAVTNSGAFPDFGWSLNPRTRQQLGGPNNFLIYQVYTELAGNVALSPALSLTGVLGINLFNNLNQLTLPSNSVLPHVRSDIAKYLKQGQTGISRLQSDYFFNIAPDLYGRVSGGLLEEMFGGVDSEVLYRPYGQRWAIGADLSYVYQRGFNELFSFQSYHVATGYLNFYYKLPFYHLQAALHVGRYLAGDVGATIDISRRFDSGIRVGVFATKTNVSAAQFGEGSFDKGFYVSIPLDLFFGVPTRDTGGFVYRPLTRDGGQQLNIAQPLYDVTDGDDPESLSRGWPHLLQ